MDKEIVLSNAFEALKKALQDSDVEKLDEIILDDYQGFTLNGTIERKQDILSSFKPGMVKITRYEVFDVQYEVFSEIGIVSGSGFIAGTFEEYSFQHQVLFMDLFKNIDGHWRYYKSQVTEIPPVS